jgi:lysophospholipase L1-like esterase
MDTDYNAPYIMPVCGTSISFGTGSSTSEGMYTWLFRNWLRETKNYRIRRINRAISGSTSTHHESLRVLEGRYDFDKTKGVFIYEHGVNDVSQGLSTAISKANLLAMIRHKQRLYPDMTMLVLAPFPVSTAQEANLAILSPALDTTVADVNDPKVIYVSTTRTCFDPVTDTTDGIHPTETGNAKIATAIINFCNSNNIQFMS